MFTLLVLFGIHYPTAVVIPNFSTKATCEQAAKTIINQRLEQLETANFDIEDEEYAVIYTCTKIQ